jgi:aryl-alcohol dehydrogenase-like predicted oxidoreductase
MTWGRQNTETEGHAQIDMALANGVNFVDTAEMYPVNPVARETVGRTEEIIGTWNAAHKGRRGDYVLATKVTGPSSNVRKEGYDGTIIRQTVEDSLRRLQTDYIDIYQLHFPQRGSYHFRQIWGYDPSGQSKAETEAHMRDVLATMKDLVAQGKVRHFGLSNDLAELCVNEDVGLLAYSPLATGLLSGKYKGGSVTPEGSRRSVNDSLGGRVGARMWAAVDAYVEIATKHGLDPVVMALAFCTARPFMGSVIFGASSEAQLEVALSAQDVVLADEVMKDIEAAHRAHPMPF